MPKIVITGRNFTEPDDKALQMLKNAGYEVIDSGNLGMAHGTPEKEVAEAVKDADAVIAGLEPYTEAVLSACPKLKLISRRGIGYDSVDVEACHRHSVTLCRTAGVVEGSVAELVMAYILYFARRIDLQKQYMQEGQWKRLMMPGVKSRTLGLVGFGGIGKEIARRAAAFDMEVEVELKQGGYLPVENNPALARELMDFFEEKDGIELIDIEPAMTGEDFGYLLSKVDGVMFWLGIDSPYALHHPKMSPKEEALSIGVEAVSSFLAKKAAE